MEGQLLAGFACNTHEEAASTGGVILELLSAVGSRRDVVPHHLAGSDA
jgi:hypothetical protein